MAENKGKKRKKATKEKRALSFDAKIDLLRLKLRKSLKFLPLIIIAIWLLTGFYIVNQDQMGVVRRFGKVVERGISPGIRWAFPWPIDQVDLIKTTEIKRMSIGYRIIDELQGIPPDPLEIQRLTGDTNIIQIKIMVQYRITRPDYFLFNVKEPHWLVRKFGEAALTRTVASMSVDDILTIRKLEIQSAVRKEIQDNLDRLNCGLIIISCNLQEVSPPLEVVDAFNDVSRAKSDMEKIKNQAQAYRNDLLPKARGNAEEILNTARTYYSEIVNRALGEASSFIDLLKEYNKAKGVTKRRLFLEIIESVLPKAKKVVIQDLPESRGKTILIK